MAAKKEKVKKMASKCLLLKTPDDRHFFTEEKNYSLLLEFGRTFDAEISIVKTKDQVEVLDMDDLVKSICTLQKDEHPEYDVVEIKLAAPAKSAAGRQEKLKKTHEVNDFIRAEFLAGKIVSLSGLEEKYTDWSKSALSAHLTRTKRELQAQGHFITRDKQGQYRISPELKPDYHEFTSLVGN